MIAGFKEYLEVFRGFIGDLGLGELKPLQYELTYVNHLPQGEGWNKLSEDIFSFRMDPERGAGQELGYRDLAAESFQDDPYL